MPTRPRTGTLPGMEARGIPDIERAAHAYVDARDARMELTEVETRKKGLVLAVMKKHGKKVYKHNTGDEIIEITLGAKDPEETVKVRIKPAEDEPATSTRKRKTVEPETGGDGEAPVGGAHEPETGGDAAGE